LPFEVPLRIKKKPYSKAFLAKARWDKPEKCDK
jgi:hypothetical protein